MFPTHFVPTVFVGDIAVWSEKARLRVNETPDKIILFIHVSNSMQRSIILQDIIVVLPAYRDMFPEVIFSFSVIIVIGSEKMCLIVHGSKLQLYLL